MADWSKDPAYPSKRDVCDHCGQRDEVKLAWDLQRYICVNAHACVLRWRRQGPLSPGDA